MKKSSLFMIFSAGLLVIGIALCIIGVSIGAGETLVLTENGLHFTDETLQAEFVTFLDSVNMEGFTITNQDRFLTQKTEATRDHYPNVVIDVDNADVEIIFRYNTPYICEYGYYEDRPIVVEENEDILYIHQEDDPTLLSDYQEGVYLKIYLPKELNFSSLYCETATGDIKLTGSELCDIEDIRLTSLTGDICTRYTKAKYVRLSSITGEIDFDIVDADSLIVENDSGNITSDRFSSDHVSITTRSGMTTVKGHADSALTIDSYSGTVNLTVTDRPENVSFYFETTSGKYNCTEDTSIMTGKSSVNIRTDLATLNLMFEYS